jgi:hypothetical protein
MGGGGPGVEQVMKGVVPDSVFIEPSLFDLFIPGVRPKTFPSFGVVGKSDGNDSSTGVQEPGIVDKSRPSAMPPRSALVSQQLIGEPNCHYRSIICAVRPPSRSRAIDSDLVRPSSGTKF